MFLGCNFVCFSITVAVIPNNFIYTIATGILMPVICGRKPFITGRQAPAVCIFIPDNIAAVYSVTGSKILNLTQLVTELYSFIPAHTLYRSLVTVKLRRIFSCYRFIQLLRYFGFLHIKNGRI